MASVEIRQHDDHRHFVLDLSEREAVAVAAYLGARVTNRGPSTFSVFSALADTLESTDLHQAYDDAYTSIFAG